jgi:hypothetical protein
MNLTIGTHELRTLQRAMQLYTKLAKKAADAGVLLPDNEINELQHCTEQIHKLIYEEQR